MIRTGHYYIFRHGDGRDKPVWFERTFCERMNGTFYEAYIMRGHANSKYPWAPMTEDYILENYREYNP